MTIAEEMARGKLVLEAIEAEWEEAREAIKNMTDAQRRNELIRSGGYKAYFDRSREIEKSRRASLTDEQRLTEDIKGHVNNIVHLKTLRQYWQSEHILVEAMDCLCQRHTPEEARELLGITALYKAKYDLIEHQKHIQSLLPDHTVGISANRETLFIEENQESARELLKYYGYKYTNKYGCVMQIGSKSYGRKYPMPDKKTAEDIADKVDGVYVFNEDESIVIWTPKCHEDKLLKVLYYTGVRGHKRLNHVTGEKDIWVHPHARAVVERRA